MVIRSIIFKKNFWDNNLAFFFFLSIPVPDNSSVLKY